MRSVAKILTVTGMQLALLSVGAAQEAPTVNSETTAARVVPTQPVDTVVLNVTADTSVRVSTPNINFGNARTLDVNRALVMVDQTTLRNAMPGGDYVLSAKLRFTVVPGLIPFLDRKISAYRVLKPWTESGATWNCAVDSNPANFLSADCSGDTKWSMLGSDAFVPTATGTGTLPLIRTGLVEVDVTEDVRNFKATPKVVNNGWLLKTGIDYIGEVAGLASSESATPPQLVLTIRRCSYDVCNDGVTCSEDGYCSTVGTCMYLIAPPISPCDDGNPCTVHDHCSGQNFDCAAGTPAPEGTECGSDLACDGNGECVPVPVGD